MENANIGKLAFSVYKLYMITNSKKVGRPRNMLLDLCCDRVQGWWQSSWSEKGTPEKDTREACS
jgi:hypothetical protein